MLTTRVLVAGALVWSVLAPHSLAGAGANPDPNRLLEERAGDLNLKLQIRTNGIQLQSLADVGRGQELLASNCPPLFQLILHRVDNKQESQLEADTAWRNVTAEQSNGVLSLAWTDPVDENLGGVSVSASATPDMANHVAAL